MMTIEPRMVACKTNTLDTLPFLIAPLVSAFSLLLVNVSLGTSPQQTT